LQKHGSAKYISYMKYIAVSDISTNGLCGKDGKNTKKWSHKEKVLRKRNKIILEQCIALLFMLFAAAYNVPCVLRNEALHMFLKVEVQNF
jgi:hypothetical protein